MKPAEARERVDAIYRGFGHSSGTLERMTALLLAVEAEALERAARVEPRCRCVGALVIRQAIRRQAAKAREAAEGLRIRL